ncbi:MAG TPA: AzlD domain-containing protein [Thermopetrobacter sp.]|nr:AzlD domain-containing protein [Thermopetrobacter sp.]
MSALPPASDAAVDMTRLLLLAVPLAGVAVTYVWRWLGVLTVSRIDPRGPLLAWVRAVATALVAALVARMVLFPSGLLAETPAAARLGGLLAGLLFWWLAGRRLAAAVGVAVAVFLLIELVLPHV